MYCSKCGENAEHKVYANDSAEFPAGPAIRICHTNDGAYIHVEEDNTTSNIVKPSDKVDHYNPPTGFDVEWGKLHALLNNLEDEGYSVQKFSAQSTEDEPEKSYAFVVEQDEN